MNAFLWTITGCAGRNKEIYFLNGKILRLFEFIKILLTFSACCCSTLSNERQRINSSALMSMHSIKSRREKCVRSLISATVDKGIADVKGEAKGQRQIKQSAEKIFTSLAYYSASEVVLGLTKLDDKIFVVDN